METQEYGFKLKEEVLRAGQVEKILGISRPRLRSMIKQKVIPVHTIGQTKFFIASEIIESIKKIG